MVYHDTRSSIPQHKWIGTCKQPVHQFMASDVVRTANASIKSDRYTPAASHAGTERLFKPNGLNNTVRTMIRAPSIQGTQPNSSSPCLFLFTPMSCHCIPFPLNLIYVAKDEELIPVFFLVLLHIHQILLQNCI